MSVIPFDIGPLKVGEPGASRTYALDMEGGRIIGMRDGKEAVNQCIKKTLLTPRFKCLIYDNQYGCEVKAAMTDSEMEDDYLETELPVIIKEALLVDDRILDVHGFMFEYGGGKDEVRIEFVADTVYGTIPVTEVV